ncbi:hypothetical protein FJZ33_01920 [Candidatus Poribacteria bacterium]|nr:hypothetical protein [Candidatus Poribacteria bacterium]
MMNFIRKKLKFLMWFVSGAFVIGLFFGAGTLGRSWFVNILPSWLLVTMPGCARSSGIMMKIGNYNVKYDEFTRIKENTVEVARIRYRDNFETYAKNMDFDKETIENLVKYAILLQETDRYGVHISKAELDDGIKNFPYQMPDEAIARVKLYPFYSLARTQDGEFNQNAFNSVLASYGKITPEQFETEVRNGLRIARLKDTLNQSAFVTDLEAEQEYRKQNEKAKIKFLEFPYKDFTGKVQVSDSELNKYFQDNQLKYKVSDKVNIKFIKLDPKEIERSIVIGDAEIESYYNARKESDYYQPEQVNARHILVKSDSSAPAAEKERAKAYAKEILKEASKPNADFAALASRYNKPPLEVIHEELGDFGRGTMAKPFEDAAFDLPIGGISDVVETNFGYHVINVINKKPTQIKTLDMVREEIASKLRSDQAAIDARQKGEDIQYTIMSAENLQAAVDANPNLNLKVEETGFFAKDEFIPKIGSNYTYKDIGEEAFKLKVGEFSDLIEVKSYNDQLMGYFIFQLISEKTGGIPKLEEVKDTVLDDIKNEKAKTLAMEEAKKAMASYVPSENLDKLAAKYNLKTIESEPFPLSSRGYIRSQSASMSSVPAMLEAFRLRPGEVSGPFDGRNGVYIIELVERDNFDNDKIKQSASEIQKLRAQILRQKQQNIYDTWYRNVKEKFKVRAFVPDLPMPS